MSWTKLALTDELPPGSLLQIERGDEPIALCNAGGQIRALYGVCPHQGGPLGEGALHGDVITCPWHAWEFDSATGLCTFDETLGVPVFPVRVENNEILVDVPDNA